MAPAPTPLPLPLPTPLVAEVGAAVDAANDALVALTQALIRIPSENPRLTGVLDGGEAAMQDCLTAAMAPLDAEISHWDVLPGRPNLVALVFGAGGGPSLALNGHVDTVPAGDAGMWRYPPFAGTVADGAIWGRGACDMKGGLAAMVTAANVVRQLGPLRGNLQLQCVIDEETGGPGTRDTIKHGYRPDFALVADTSNLVIHPVAGGLEWLRLTIRGVAGHSARRYRSVHAGGEGTAVNALEKGMVILRAVQELERAWAVRKVHPLLPPGITTINPAVLVAGSGGGQHGMANVLSAVSTMPDYCSLELSLTYLPGETREEVRAEFEAYLARVCATDAWLAAHPPTIEWGLRRVSFPPVDGAADQPGVVTLAACLRAAGREPTIAGGHAVGDTAWYAAAGIPSVRCGPGKIEHAHGVDERVAIADLVESTKVMALMMIAWCGLA